MISRLERHTSRFLSAREQFANRVQCGATLFYATHRQETIGVLGYLQVIRTALIITPSKLETSPCKMDVLAVRTLGTGMRRGKTPHECTFIRKVIPRGRIVPIRAW